MPGLLDLGAQEGAMAQNAADDALEQQGRLHDRNAAIKAQNWQEAGKIATGLADSYGKYKGAQEQKAADAKKQAGGTPSTADTSSLPPSAWAVAMGSIGRAFNSGGDE
jgi:hypothetical protein